MAVYVRVMRKCSSTWINIKSYQSTAFTCSQSIDMFVCVCVLWRYWSASHSHIFKYIKYHVCNITFSILFIDVNFLPSSRIPTQRFLLIFFFISYFRFPSYIYNISPSLCYFMLPSYLLFMITKLLLCSNNFSTSYSHFSHSLTVAAALWRHISYMWLLLWGWVSLFSVMIDLL
jgi:hypothetical protein